MISLIACIDDIIFYPSVSDLCFYDERTGDITKIAYSGENLEIAAREKYFYVFYDQSDVYYVE